jgi:hypothetical protein
MILARFGVSIYVCGVGFMKNKNPSVNKLLLHFVTEIYFEPDSKGNIPIQIKFVGI